MLTFVQAWSIFVNANISFIVKVTISVYFYFNKSCSLTIFVIFAKIVVMIWQWNKIQINCEIIYFLWVHPVAIMVCKTLPLPNKQRQWEPRGVCENKLLAVPLPRAARSLTWSDWFKLKLRAMAEGQQGGKIPIPRLAPPLPTSKRRRKRKSFEEKQCKKKELDRARNKTRINIGASFRRWRELQILQGLKSDAELAALLLDK